MAELGPRDIVARAIARRAAATGADVTGEPAYVLELNVYLLDREEPELTLRSIVPLSEEERREATSK